MARSAEAETLYLLVVTTRHGDSYELYASEDAAKEGVYSFVVQAWSEMFRGPMPEDRDVAIDSYFEDTPEDDWRIEALTVQGVAS